MVFVTDCGRCPNPSSVPQGKRIVDSRLIRGTTVCKFKRVHPRVSIYSVRLVKHYRAVGKRDDEGMLWFWIGSPADYDQMLKQI